jgi:hypothetical protein
MDERVPNARPGLPVVVEQNPVQQRAGIVGTAMASVGMAAIVVLVLYGLSRPEPPPQTASAPGQTAQPAPGGPSTTGQGQGQAEGGRPDTQQPDRGKGERSDSATTGAQPSDRPKPPEQ